jgi:diguanylate cyclase (GGDEF)-like protein
MWHAALESYVSVIQSLEKHAVALDQEDLSEYRAKLQGLKVKLETTELTSGALRDVASDLDSEIKNYRIEVEALIKESATDLKEVVAVLAEATESLSQRENRHGTQLSRISGGLEAISQIDDLGQVRTTLNRQVAELRACISSMARDNESALADLQREIGVFQQKLEKVQVEASTDPLTGLANRRRCTREISNRVRSRNPFGILLFDLNKFKSINDTLGHAAGDFVLHMIAQRLVTQIRSEDLVCRWGGDEFVVVQNGLAEEVAARGREITKHLSGSFSIEVSGVTHQVTVGAGFGWAEYQQGETPEQLFARADRILYATKGTEPKREISTPEAKSMGIAAESCASPSTGLSVEVSMDNALGIPNYEALEARLASLGSDRGEWFLGCFAIRSAARVNNHYGFPATDTVLPFLRDDLSGSKFGPALFRGRGSCILALVKLPGGQDVLEAELRRLCRIGLERHLQQKRRASILPIALGGKLFSAADQECLSQVNSFIELQRAGESAMPAAAGARSIERILAPQKP